MTTWTFLLCILLAVVLGIGTAIVFSFKARNSASMALTLSIMPAAIAIVIMMVNGNVGAGVAVAGAFTLVRFRSVPGTAREIAAIFMDMAVGLACGMGHIWIAILFFVIMAVLVIALTLFGFGERSGNQQLKITIPENLDYNDLFDDLFKKYTSSWELVRVRTTNMGTEYHSGTPCGGSNALRLFHFRLKTDRRSCFDAAPSVCFIISQFSASRA